MTLTEDDAGKVLEAVTTILQKQGALQILDGIDESRRLGVEEELPQQKSSELKQVARTRRRPPNNSEMIHIVLQLLYQQLIVLPRIGTALKTRLGVGELFWRVDTEFVSADRLPESRLSDLMPDGAMNLLDAGGVDEVAARHGKALFDRNDIERAKNFHAMLKERFAKDLAVLQVKFS